MRLRLRTFIQFIFLGIIVSSCISEGFKIDGVIQNKSGETIYLEKLKVRELVPYDSAIIDKKGRFMFTGEFEEPTFFILKMSGTEFITLLVEPNEHMNIKLNPDNFNKEYSVKGSVGSALIKDLNTRLYQTMDRLDSISQVFRDSANEENKHLLKKELDSISKSVIDHHTEYLKTFIKENNKSLAVIPAIFQQYGPYRYFMNPSIDFELFKLVDTSLNSVYSDLEQVKAFHAYVKDQERKLSEQKINERILGIGAVAPDISLASPEGDTLNLSDLRGKYVLLDFWASWCRPCRVENPNLVKNYQKYKNKGFEIFQVSLDKTHSAWTDAIATDQLEWYHVSDLKYWNSGPARLYNVRSIPANYLLDKEGKILAKDLRGAALGAKLAEILANE